MKFLTSKAMIVCAPLVLAASPALAGNGNGAGEIGGEINADQIEQELEAGLIPLAQGRAQCANFAGTWRADCAVTLSRAGVTQNVQRMRTVTITQDACEKVTVNNFPLEVDVAVNVAFASQRGFRNAQGGLFWETDNKLGFAKEVGGMLYDGHVYKKLVAHGNIEKTAEGAVRLTEEGVLKKYAENDQANVEETRISTACGLTRAQVQ